MAVDHHFLRGKRILDAGCGIGRLATSISRYAKEVVALDFSGGVDEAFILNEKNPTAHIVQGDIMQLPFRRESFDYAYSKGVLHYVADVKKCLVSLSSVIRPGGALSVTIYPKMAPQFETFNRLMRQVTVKLPVALIYHLSFPLIPFLSLAWRWSGMKSRPIAWNERAHMIFNWFASEFQNRASNKEMASRFRALNFGQVRFSKIPVGITGFKGSVSEEGDC
jgi:SAM-dependent methyltransferase